MRNTMFATQVRMLLCEHCGAPLETTIEGGAVPCSYCKATNAVRPRLDRFTDTSASTLSEPERLARLRAQEGQPFVIHPAIARLTRGGVLEEHRLGEAFDVFQATRQELKQTASADASERLYALVVVVTNALAGTKDNKRIRSVVETALDDVVLERHKTTLRSMLARASVREGDLDSAEQWLAGSNPRSDDLTSDSDYRVARAAIDTARRNADAVLATLGRTASEIPIAGHIDLLAGLLRANALEMSGDVDGATRMLEELMKAGGAARRAEIESVVEAQAALHLCPQSLPRAQSAAMKRHMVTLPKLALQLARGPGLFFLLMVLLAVAGLFSLTPDTWEVLRAAIASGNIRIFFELLLRPDARPLLGILVLEGIVLAFGLSVGLAMVRLALRANRLVASGIHVCGHVAAIKTTNAVQNNRPVAMVTFRWTIQGESHEVTQTMTLAPGLAVGATFPMLVDPKNPKNVMIALDSTLPMHASRW